MKTKSILAGLLTSAVCLTMLTACSGGTAGNNSSQESKTGSSQSEQSKTGESKTDESKTSEDSKPSDTKTDTYTLYIRDAGKQPEITATFLNTQSGASEDVKMTRKEEADDHYIYTCDNDVTKFNMVHFSYGDTVTDEVSFNTFVSGWYLYNDELLPYTVGKEPSYAPKYETKVFEFDGYEKKVYIWTPDDYDAKAAEKYSTIYMFDGQTVLTTEMTGEMRCWNVSECVEGMMAATDNKAILVCIDNNDLTRFDELVPDLGTVIDGLNSKKRGTEFCKFLVETVVPFVHENYNVSTDAASQSVCGSSLGGLEAFYAGMEHPEIFGTVGALSASFQAFNEEDWEKYLSAKKSLTDLPFIYMYAGGYYKDTGFCDEPMNNTLIEHGFPKDKLVFSKNEKGEHFVQYWRAIYPEFLEAMFTNKVSALESGALVSYNDKTRPNELDPDISKDEESDSRSPEVKKYIYFDNSNTKWDTVWAYWWGGSYINNAVTGAEGYYKDWPGFEMEKIDGTDYFRVEAPDGATNIIFGSGVKDVDVANGTVAYQTLDLFYSYDVMGGQAYKIDTSEEPKPGKGVEKTKFKYQNGSWTRYDP